MPTIVVEVSGGVVCDIYSKDNVEAVILDWDNEDNEVYDETSTPTSQLFKTISPEMKDTLLRHGVTE